MSQSKPQSKQGLQSQPSKTEKNNLYQHDRAQQNQRVVLFCSKLDEVQVHVHGADYNQLMSIGCHIAVQQI